MHKTIDAALETAKRTTSSEENPTPALGWQPTIDLSRDTTGTVAKMANEAALMVAEMQAGRAPRWLTISGTRGSGKTMIARAIIEQARRINPGNASLWYGPMRRPRCIWYNETDFADAIREHHRLPEYLSEDYLVVIDDLGTARERFDMVADALYRLANARLGAWTVWTTNLTHAEIDQRIDARLASRLIRDRNRCVKVTARDYSLPTPKETQQQTP